MIYVTYRLDGYTNALAFQGITDEQIANTEKFVREEMYNYLIRTTAETINENDESFAIDTDDVFITITKEQLIDHFGKVYATDPSNFRFQSGEIILIKEMVKHVKSKFDSQQKTGLKVFKTNQPKKTNKFSTKSSLSEPNVDKLKSELIQRVIKCMQSYEADNFFDGDVDCGVHDDTVNVRIIKGAGVYGSVRCEICETQNKKKNKPKSVYYNDNSKWPNWVIANFIKHLQQAHNLKIREPKTQKPKSASVASTAKQVQSIDNAHEVLNESDVILVGPTANVVVEDTVDVVVQTDKTKSEIPIFTQLTSQINLMMTSVLENTDSREEMGFMISNTMQTVSVAKIDPDGNCLFSALAHQLFQLKIHSKFHTAKTRELRKSVVKYILNPINFPKFMHDLKDRVYETKKHNEIENMETECKLYVKLCLAKTSVWGGTETIYAVAELEKVNVLIFNEHGDFYTLRNTKQYDRTICIAYRLPRDQYGEIISGARFHYDSVCDIDSSTLCEVAKTYERREK